MSAKEKKLILGLEILTEGAAAAGPRAFRVERYMKAAEKTKKISRSWTMGSGIQGLGVSEKITGGIRLRARAKPGPCRTAGSRVSAPVPDLVAQNAISRRIQFP